MHHYLHTVDSVAQQKTRFGTYLNWFGVRRRIADPEPRYKFTHRFVVGTKNLPSDTVAQIQQEAGQFADMFVHDQFEDNYRNLTQKLLLAMRRTVHEYNFKYLLKTDDDTYVKLNEVLADLHVYHDKLEMLAGQPMPELYWGYFNGRAQVKQVGKWKEPNYNLGDRYLPYALGGGYVLSRV